MSLLSQPFCLFSFKKIRCNNKNDYANYALRIIIYTQIIRETLLKNNVFLLVIRQLTTQKLCIM